MTEWWNALGDAQQVFYIIAITSSVVLFIQFLLTLMGLSGHDVDVGDSSGFDVPHDMAVDHPDLDAHSSGLGMLSTRTILAFFVGFGWAGVAALGDPNRPLIVVVALALLFGGIFMFVVFRLMSAIAGLSESGNIDVRNAVGQDARVYIPVPPAREATGQVQVKVQGRLREIAAVTDDDEKIPTGTPVRVVDYVGDNILLVKRLEAKS